MHTQNIREKTRTLRARLLITICYPRLSQFSGRRAGEEDESDPCSSRGKKRLLLTRVQTVCQAYGYVELVSATTVSLTNLYYDGAGGDFCTFCTLDLGKHEREKTSVSAELAEVAVSLSAGPKTNWIVGTKSSIGVDSNTIIIDGLTASGEVRLVNSLWPNHPPQPATESCPHLLTQPPSPPCPARPCTPTPRT